MLCINMYWQGSVVAEYWVHSARHGGTCEWSYGGEENNYESVLCHTLEKGKQKQSIYKVEIMKDL